MSENKLKEMEFNQNNYKNKLAGIIERVENNHFKWYIILITLFLSNITTNAGLINIRYFYVRLVCLITVSLAYLIIISISLYNSNNYLLMGRCFRELEKRSYDTKNLNDFNWKAQKNDKTKKPGFVQISGILILLLNFIQSIIFIIMSIFLIK